MNQLVVGLGQIGTAVRQVLKCDGRDLVGQEQTKEKYDVLHICIPYNELFIESVKSYETIYEPEIVVIHSTVPIGTTRKLGDKYVYSPVRGKHPHLADSLKTFLKFVAGPKAFEVFQIFTKAGIPAFITTDTDSTEAMKLWDTTIYGWNIILEKEIYKYCEENDLDFDTVYTGANNSYNNGYRGLGHPEYTKYVLKHTDGPIGGHCVIPNLDLLNAGLITDTIKNYK